MAASKITLTTNLSDALKNLIDQYNSTASYQGMTDDEIRNRAEGEYQSYYDQLRLAAQQAYERNDLARQNELAGLQAGYDRTLDETAKEYRRAYSQADRSMLGRGLGRSTYAAQTLANLQQQGAQAQQDIWNQRATAEAGINAQRAQLSDQLSQQMQQYAASQAADTMNRRRELEQQNYERGMQNTQYLNQLAAQIYGIMADSGQIPWTEQKDTGGGYYDYAATTKKKNSGTGTQKPAAQQTNLYDSFMNALNAGNTNTGNVIKNAVTLGTGLYNAGSSLVNNIANVFTNAQNKNKTTKTTTTTTGGLSKR